ncbi:WD40 repeat-like protein [Xylona heveae TC161]|uniref:WD40 repeat-like protein n=1 Tax=Xylona heveae (strain CBS 132557 / TC161) TaxID=1328760 RepID=A0A161TBB6_XYLHT|nr:WD40 repeat-like protein [Xylona heveae TC161]KZF22957.1 WD40 repeat-like protein [Xylona heveae TC161]
MSSSNQPFQDDETMDEEHQDVMLDAAEAGEEILQDDDAHMESDDDNEDPSALQEIQLQNDSVAHFDTHKDSIFCIAQHPRLPDIVATGGGDDLAYVFNSTPPDQPVLPASYQTQPAEPTERETLNTISKLEGHTDSVNAITFTLPHGEFVVTAGLDGRLRAYRDTSGNASGQKWTFLAEAQEVEEINWLVPCPHPDYPNTVAIGANDGSVWVYTINAADKASPLTIVQAFYLHTMASTAGAWTPDGKLLATVSEDGTFYVWDVFSEAAVAGVGQGEGGQAVVGLTPEDQRFAVEGGLYSVAVAPSGTFAAVGGAGGIVKIVGLPRIGADPSVTAGAKGAGASSKNRGGKRGGGPTGGNSTASSTGAGQAGQILASLATQSDGVETLSFAAPPLTLLAAGSVDGSIALYDTAHRFAVRRHIKEAHEEYAVVKVEFLPPSSVSSAGDAAGVPAGSWLLTSAGMDGVVRRWDTRGGTAAAAQGLAAEWKGHRGEGEGGGVLGFIQGGGIGRVVTAGDDGVSLVFPATTS